MEVFAILSLGTLGALRTGLAPCSLFTCRSLRSSHTVRSVGTSCSHGSRWPGDSRGRPSSRSWWPLHAWLSRFPWSSRIPWLPRSPGRACFPSPASHSHSSLRALDALGTHVSCFTSGADGSLEALEPLRPYRTLRPTGSLGTGRTRRALYASHSTIPSRASQSRRPILHVDVNMGWTLHYLEECILFLLELLDLLDQFLYLNLPWVFCADSNLRSDDISNVRDVVP
mmetsp:Transcript_5560/g.19526  ORF Transcript_5560/g.19526 Transcript_5560/m.19526 type:complete len:227 (-) Transcript_5560:325-1005(-)